MNAVKVLHIVALLALLTMGCSRRASDCSASDSQTVVEPALLSFLSRARAAHHLADNQEALHPEQALATLSTVLHGPRPGAPNRLAPEVSEVLADTAARVADLESRLERFDSASRTLRDALLWVPDVSYFRGHLYEVSGIVEERRAHALERQNDAQEAQAARSRAMVAFEESMKIHAEVIRTASIDAGK